MTCLQKFTCTPPFVPFSYTFTSMAFDASHSSLLIWQHALAEG